MPLRWQRPRPAPCGLARGSKHRTLATALGAHRPSATSRRSAPRASGRRGRVSPGLGRRAGSSPDGETPRLSPGGLAPPEVGAQRGPRGSRANLAGSPGRGRLRLRPGSRASRSRVALLLRRSGRVPDCRRTREPEPAGRGVGSGRGSRRRRRRSGPRESPRPFAALGCFSLFPAVAQGRGPRQEVSPGPAGANKPTPLRLSRPRSGTFDLSRLPPSPPTGAACPAERPRPPEPGARWVPAALAPRVADRRLPGLPLTRLQMSSSLND
ncbi:hypothetical protein J1605_007233 [Eschrichtius robustus]|uniref:Uncharacterized protein n=1 Tax=Eschrichtius robustus TaxID=9764 RepID=A0AB34GYQ9_ESCRO|nr:hypothetical protein J1605_007233 [Eschrichtius robustus]